MLLTPALRLLITTALGRDVGRTPGKTADRKEVELTALSWMKVMNVQDLPFLLVRLQGSPLLALFFLTFSFILITMLC